MNIIFNSFLSEEITTYIDYKRTLGRKYNNEEKALGLFDRYLIEQYILSIDELQPMFIDSFLNSRPRIGAWVDRHHWSFFDGLESGSSLLDTVALTFFIEHPLVAPVFRAIQLSRKNYILDEMSDENTPPGCLLIDGEHKGIYLGDYKAIESYLKAKLSPRIFLVTR
ncbi:MAG: hypothetical protein QNL62_10160 [Gammaproteobacteria bacterium]|nr:hypothetical protein [Gammaproteobacteria bacterium]